MRDGPVDADTHRLLQADGQVDHGHVGGGDAEGHAGDLAATQDIRQDHTPSPLTVLLCTDLLKTFPSQT